MSKALVATKAAQKLEALTKELMTEAAAEATAAADLQTYANIARLITGLARNLRGWKEDTKDSEAFGPWDRG